MADYHSTGIARNISYKVLFDVYYNDAYSNLSIKKHFNALKKDEDKALATNIIFGTIKKDIFLSEVVKKLSSVDYDKIKPEIQVILKAGIYQLYFMDRVPAYAVVNDCVNLAKLFVSNKTGSFVNAVLRNAIRRKKEFENIKNDSDIPLWLTIYLSRFYDDVFLQTMEEDFLKSPDMFVRVNKLKSAPQDVYEELNREEKICEATFMPDVFKALKPSAVLNNELMKNCTISVQDISAALCAYALGAQEGDSIIDLCASPGGKSLHIASLTGNKAEITACDIYKHKIEFMKNIFKCFGADIEVIKNDAEEYCEEFYEKFDKVLLDAPCSGLGVIRRKPEILLRLSQQDIQNLIKMQESMLKNAAKYVKKGGVLLYSTCSINPEENELQIRKFLNDNNEFSLEDIVFPEKFYDNIDISSKGEIKLYSHEFFGDGFYICKLVKS
ncbi:MAG: 16S rRNA (cytosine(967)-C(5))-methyltransferase RsmB [Eubacteriaceae bacterium]|nr:16S rRNA (cytosine(967)-C(5))-methyltransferase RsmB [Eubacteriaceae bacterium]